ncbi:AraC family transcriptional regulator [Ammoniphilus sp. CFH 90114]|nr:AraC family transcriptional regulator [Ammoniphilus sp. CFH 90114]
MILAGISERTSNVVEASEGGKLPGMWNTFFGGQVTNKLGGVTEIHREKIYSLYTDYENGANGEYTVVIGHQVTGKSNDFSDGLKSVVVPEAKYAVFTSRRGPVSQVVPEMWQTIWNWTVSTSARRTFTGDFEVYEVENFNPSDAVVEIYIAVE